MNTLSRVCGFPPHCFCKYWWSIIHLIIILISFLHSPSPQCGLFHSPHEELRIIEERNSCVDSGFQDLRAKKEEPYRNVLVASNLSMCYSVDLPDCSTDKCFKKLLAKLQSNKLFVL